ncbi:PilN domain-containing protein [Thermoanaerobacterium sp. RBIITD]|uniref:PilN domain-containing protein n=1 Tax=Thermoanaerobacterium sp. RBIITD TaxID=1550240 RepID=UPI000BB88F0A|nr:PilN domain-containing protein [Thermoanaerobacterium sp. RBIITD]SNX55349.1 type IV pilus assembly protein PilN [Thermoanaerobacterium sp. RBIITD]
MKDINLIPEEIKTREYNKKKKIRNLVNGVIILCIFSAIIFLPQIYIQKLNHDKSVFNNKLSQLKEKTDIELKVQNRIKYLADKEALIKVLNKNKFDMTKILDDISVNIPDKVSITDLKFSNNVIEITGNTYMNKFLSDFMQNLRKLNYVDDINLVSAKKSDNGLIKYTLQIKLKVV